ncbi:MAG: hypothetical protein EXX96DRAFT_609163 [Benjaminiella poitrasii]|nr:MAG: hypothetical protein EXX96DRAFT_609163 [Benjaminiella poitrasii]
MSPENNLFQFAQVITELPFQHAATAPTISPHINHYHPRYMRIRKNACVVCNICFTCSKYYGRDCTCQEAQPRRGKNLPEGGLDSRAKKLHRDDSSDYEFSINWINENAHSMYKDEHDQVIGLRELTEVSLCKAHSSTLYRAKKRHERNTMLQHQVTAPPSPADSTITNPYPTTTTSTTTATPPTISSGGLAAKVKEISSSTTSHFRVHEAVAAITSPNFTRLSYSTSNKRKRMAKYSPKIDSNRPYNSLSTPLYNNSSNTSTRTNNNNHASFVQQQQLSSIQQPQQILDNFPSHQLPPLLQTRNNDIEQQIYPPVNNNDSVLNATAAAANVATPNANANASADTASSIVVETVSLKPLNMIPPSSSPVYYFRNLAITDTFTFRDLLSEIDMTGSPPPGKRIVISDSEKIYPLDQAIRSVIRRPTSSHIELSLGLTDKPSIDWNTFSS